MLIPFLKLLALAALSPIWFPILRELYREVEAALLEEGGLLGRPPTPEELVRLREKYKDYQNPLVSVPWAEARAEADRERKAEKQNRGKGKSGKGQGAERSGPPKRGTTIRTNGSSRGGGFSS